MRIITINIRKYRVFFILMFLMGIILSTGLILKDNLKCLSFIQNDITNLKKFKILHNDITYKLPHNWNTEEKKFDGNQIVYHNNFKSEDLKTSGFVQVWSRQKDLKEFLDKSKDIANKQNKIRNYNIKNLNINDKKGYMISYIMDIKGIEYMTNEYFIKYKDGFIRFSFFNKSDNLNKNTKSMYESIINTVHLK